MDPKKRHAYKLMPMHMHKSVNKTKHERKKNKDNKTKKQMKNTHTHIYKTHRKGREFGLVSDGAVLLHKAAVWQL